jgi:hypothetical protein
MSDWSDLSRYARRSRTLLVTPAITIPFSNEKDGVVLRKLARHAHLRIGIETRFTGDGIDDLTNLPTLARSIGKWWNKVSIWIDNGLFKALINGTIHSDEDMIRLMQNYGEALCKAMQVLESEGVDYSDLVVAPADPLIPDPLMYVKKINQYLNVLLNTCPNLVTNEHVRFMIPLHHYSAPLVNDNVPVPEEFYFTHKSLMKMYRAIIKSVMRAFLARGVTISAEHVARRKVWWGVGAVGVENTKYIPSRNRTNAVTDVMRILDAIILIRNIYPKTHIHLLRLNKTRIPLLSFVDSVDSTFDGVLRSYRIPLKNNGVFDDGNSVNLNYDRTVFSLLTTIMTHIITGTTSEYLMDGNQDEDINEFVWLND